MTIIAEKPSLGPDDAGLALSREEFAEADFQEPYIYERVQGRLVIMSPAGPEHRFVSRPFRRELCAYWATHRELVDDVDIEGWVATTDEDDRLPDICVYLVGPSSHQSVPERVPELIFEFVSRDRSDQERDYIDKRREYHAIGVKEYVIVDRFKRNALVLNWEPGDYSELRLKHSENYTTPLLPGLSIALRDAFANC